MSWKMNGVFVDSNDLKNVYELLDTSIELQSDKEITRSAKDVIARYGLLPIDALIAATCKHHGIRKIVTFCLCREKKSNADIYFIDNR